MRRERREWRHLENKLEAIDEDGVDVLYPMLARVEDDIAQSGWLSQCGRYRKFSAKPPLSLNSSPHSTVSLEDLQGTKTEELLCGREVLGMIYLSGGVD
jgi:hypothetical protein